MGEDKIIEPLPQVLVDAAYGRAMLSAHALERKLRTLLLIHFGEVRLNNNRRTAATEQIQRLTMGPLIEQFITAYKVEEHLQEELDNMLFFRNELAHRISDTILGKALEPDWRRRLVTELLEIESYFRETNQSLEHYIDEWLEANGFSKQQIISIGMGVYKGLAGG